MAERTLFFVLATIIALASAAKRNYKICKSHEDPSFNACLEEAANIYFAHLDEELDGIHHTFKPMENSINNGPLNINLVYNITKFLNSTKLATVILKYDATTKVLRGGIKAPHVGFETHIEVEGKLGKIKMLGEGIALFHVYEMDASFETKVHIKPGSDKLYEMEELNFRVNKFKKAMIEITQLKSPSKELEIALRGVATNFPDLLYSLSKDVWDNNLRTHYEDLTREFLKEMLDDGLVSK